MSEPKYLEFLLSLKKGTFLCLGVCRPMKMKKDCEQLYKVYDCTVKAGIDYDNIGIVQENRENGLLPETNTGLQGKQKWIAFPYVIRQEDGSFHYRFTRTGLNPPVYKIVNCNGVEVSLEIAKEKCLAKEFKSGDVVFQVSEVNIVRLTQGECE